jgi:hypothetical protein
MNDLEELKKRLLKKLLNEELKIKEVEEYI